MNAFTGSHARLGNRERIDILPEPRDLAVTHRPEMGIGSVDRFAGCAMNAPKAADRQNSVRLDQIFGWNDREFLPVLLQRDKNAFRNVPGAGAARFVGPHGNPINIGCESAWKKYPVMGVIGVQ